MLPSGSPALVPNVASGPNDTKLTIMHVARPLLVDLNQPRLSLCVFNTALPRLLMHPCILCSMATLAMSNPSTPAQIPEIQILTDQASVPHYHGPSCNRGLSLAQQHVRPWQCFNATVRQKQFHTRHDVQLRSPPTTQLPARVHYTKATKREEDVGRGRYVPEAVPPTARSRSPGG